MILPTSCKYSADLLIEIKNQNIILPTSCKYSADLLIEIKNQKPLSIIFQFCGSQFYW
jgi:hypothetical protein